MKLPNRLLTSSALLLVVASNVCAEVKITPSIYSRGGMTRSTDLKSRHILDNGDDRKDFNLGAWGDESNTISDDLTELTAKFDLNSNFYYTYGVDINGNRRFLEGNETADHKSLDERLNFLTFKDNDFSLWVGQNAYRGDGDYLTRNFPFDEHNMMGGGVRIEKMGPINIEFAYGEVTQEVTDPKVVNLFINKIEYPLTNGKLKTNLELHRINATSDTNESKTFLAGVQLQRWGIKLLDGNFYHIMLINYSNGYVYGGQMQSGYNEISKDLDESKILAQWAGDWKWANEKALYFTVKYQEHSGNNDNQKWSFVDYYVRPVKNVTPNTAIGLDLAQRFITKENKDSNKSWMENGTNSRVAFMASYHLKDKMFELPSVSLFAGRIFKDKPTQFFTDKPSAREEDFLRLNYEVAF